MNHYCTYLDSGFLLQGLALWRSLAAHDRAAVLWVLALDDTTAAGLRALGADDLRVLTPEDLERADPELARSRATRSALEHLFTFSPCLPRHLLRNHPPHPPRFFVTDVPGRFERVGGEFLGAALQAVEQVELEPLADGPH